MVLSVYEMKWISLVCVLCLLQLASAICKCSDGQQLLIPLRFNIDPPSAFNDTDGSPSSFGSTCVEQGTFYQCNNNTNNPLFDCSASNNSYYGWTDQQLSVSSTFVQDHYFQSRKNFSEINVSVIFLISTASNVSVPTQLQYSVFLDGIFVSTVRDDNPPASLPEGPYQYNYTLSPGGEFNQVVITIYRNTTFQWIAINRIIFCAASTEVQSSSTPLMSSSSSLTTVSTMSSPGSLTMSSTMPLTTSPTMSATISPTTSSTVSPTTSNILSHLATVSPIVSAISPPVSRMDASTVSPTESATATSDNDDDSVSVAVVSGTVIGTSLLIIVIFVVVIMMMIVCSRRRKESRRSYNIDDNNVTVKLSSHAPNTQQHTSNTSGAKVDPTSRQERVNALHIPTEVKSLDSLLQRHDVIGSDVIITPNPSYSVGPNSLDTGKDCEYQYDYVQTDDGLVECDKVVGFPNSGKVYDEITDRADNVNIDLDPSYSLAQDIKLEDNPSYDKLLL